MSRDRFWGTPLPVWRNDADPSRMVCVGSLAELQELSGVDLADPHRPYVDEVTFTRAGEDGTYRRVPQVIDAWFDSGAMPFAQFGAPYRNADIARAAYPADFICEAIDQTRGWFYSLMAVGTLVNDENAYRTVLCLGHILAEDGRKMSKHLGNILEPIPLMERHGADAVRWFMLCTRLAVVVAAGRAQGARRDRVEGAAHLLVGGVVPVAVRARKPLGARAIGGDPDACSTGGRCPRCTGSPPRSTRRWRTSTPPAPGGP